MIYSVHNPFTGVFDYFEAGPDVPINDDLPTPRWGNDITTKLGVPSSLAGRPLPPGALKVGSGPLPQGLISSGRPGVWRGTQKGELPSGMGSLAAVGTQPLTIACLAGAGASAAYGWQREGKAWPFLGLSALLLAGAVVTAAKGL